MFLRAHLSASVVGLIFHITNELTIHLYKQNGSESSTKNVPLGGRRSVRTVKRISTNNQQCWSTIVSLLHKQRRSAINRDDFTCFSSATILHTMPFRTDHNTGNSPASVPPRPHVPCPSVQITTLGTHLLQFRHDLTYHALPYRSQHWELTCFSSATISRTMPFRTDHNTGNSPASVPPRSHVPCPSVQITTLGTHLLQFRHDLMYHALPYRSQHWELTSFSSATISRTMPFRTDHNTGNSPASVPPRSHVPCPSIQITTLGTHQLQFRHDLMYHALPYRSHHRELTCFSSATNSRTMSFRTDHNTGNSPAHFRHDLMYHALPYRSHHRELTCFSSATNSRTMSFRTDHNTGNSPAHFRHDLMYHALP